jgi:hypothetical protein
MMLAGSAWAEWVMYGKNKEATFYYDPTTIRKEGNMRRIWELHNLRERHKDGEISVRYRSEYDCMDERIRILGVTEHSEPMAGGAVLTTVGEDNNWMPIAPETIGAILLNLVCAK